MFLFFLTRDQFEYDEHDAVLIRAETELQAREIAAHHLYPKGDVWRTCKAEIIHEEGDVGEVLASFNAG